MMSFRTIKVVSCVCMAAVTLLLASCQVATPATRIEQNPVLFQSLPVEDKLLVQRGQIREGMSPGAVFLAWGYPNSQPYVGEKEGKRLERWVYTRSEPVMVISAWGGACWYHSCYSMPDTLYVTRNTASVTFENDKVVSWEAQR